MPPYHLIKVYFDRRSAKATDAWLQRRFDFFRNWTLPSLLNQTFRDFRLWFHLDPGMEQVAQPLRALAPAGSLFTFLPYGHTPLDQLDTRSMLLGDDERHQAAEWIYVTRIDSDDLYCQDLMELVSQVEPLTADPDGRLGGIQAAMCHRGYMHDVYTGRTAVYHNNSSPFHTLLIPKAIWEDPAKYRAQFIGDHSRVAAAYPTQSLPDWRFTVLLHADNFLTGQPEGKLDWAKDRSSPVERYWTEQYPADDPSGHPMRQLAWSACGVWQARPVVFDLDDFCDQHASHTLACLDALKQRYPYFKATLFTIPGLTSSGLIEQTLRRDWLQLAVHGLHHQPNEELKEVLPSTLHSLLQSINTYGSEHYVKGFRPPGWYITREHVEACNQAGCWVALHQRDERTLGPLCRHGYFVSDSSVNSRQDCWHGHTHDTCNNGIEQTIKELLTRWPSQQQFLFVQDAALMPQK